MSWRPFLCKALPALLGCLLIMPPIMMPWLRVRAVIGEPFNSSSLLDCQFSSQCALPQLSSNSYYPIALPDDSPEGRYSQVGERGREYGYFEIFLVNSFPQMALQPDGGTGQVVSTTSKSFLGHSFPPMLLQSCEGAVEGIVVTSEAFWINSCCSMLL